MTSTNEPIGKARANIYFVDCPIETCEGYLTTASGDEKWRPEDFTRGATARCDECGQTFKVRR